MQYPYELVLSFLRTRPERRPICYILCQRKHQLTDIHGFANVTGHRADDGVHLVPDRLPRLSPLAAEELHDAQLTHLAPEGAVVGEGHVGAVVGEVADGYGGRSVGEDVVVHLKDLTSGVRVGDGHHVEEAHFEVENAAVFGG